LKKNRKRSVSNEKNYFTFFLKKHNFQPRQKKKLPSTLDVMATSEEMSVMKRDGTKEPMAFDKILTRVRRLGTAMRPILMLDYAKLVIGIVQKLHDGIETRQIDVLTAQECAARVTDHPDFGVLAGRIILSNNQKSTSASFEAVTDRVAEVLDPDYVQMVHDHAEMYQSMLRYDRDYVIDYFGYMTLQRAYLLRTKEGEIAERPQHLWLRVAIALHRTDFERVKETYDLLSTKQMIHATPTLFNAGTRNPQFSSCFLVGLQEDSIDGIFGTLGDCARISKHAGGIGLHIHKLRCRGSPIHGTNGTSNGLVPMLRVFNETARYVDQGGGKRNGSISIYLSPDHADIEAWLDLKRNTGEEHNRARDLFYGLWVPDLFMRRVKADARWSVFCPNKCPGLSEVHGKDYDELYERYEKEGRAEKEMAARDLWFKILDAQMETGTPSLLFKDACNAKSNQKNLGTIQSSNLCTEIIQYSDSDETAVCNLASLSLPSFVDTHHDPTVEGLALIKSFNFERLHAVTKVVTHNLDIVVDRTFYPTERARRSNARHRPLGIGVQGLADVFFKMNLPFDCEEARQLNKDIFETMYHAAMETSVELAREKGPYASFVGSPLSEGLFQFDLWGQEAPSTRYNWEKLRLDVITHGARNSLLIAPMPTASTSQILGNTECFEPMTSNLYTRRTLAGEFILVNEYLLRELIDLGVWSQDLKNDIIQHQGSVQHLDIPAKTKLKFRTVWEIPMRSVVDMSRDRAVFICQSQSLNLFIADPNYKILTSMHFHSWEAGLKTGCYYLRRRPRYNAQPVTVPPVCLTCSA
jgi:ribonucleoside-diphosphate reductase alpha chain